MRVCVSILIKILVLVIGLSSFNAVADTANNQVTVPILVYHNFDPVKGGPMTITAARFEEQLKYLKDNGYTVIPLKTLVDYLEGRGPAPAPKSVVITADDGRMSVYTQMLPLIRKYDIPVTLFIYPSSISNASYAMTWDQLRELQKDKHFDIQGHTYWHPNFKHEKKKLPPAEYQKMLDMQLVKSKSKINKELGTQVTLLAWPFGIYDDQLESEAAKDGYLMAFSIDARNASKAEKVMSQPRYMIVTEQNMKEFAAIVSGHAQNKLAKKE